MQVEKPKIELYQNRSFGQKLSATFDFLRENYKLWLKACFYLILPLCLVQAFSFDMMFSTLMPFYADALGGMGGFTPSEGLLVRLGLSYFGYFVCISVGSFLLSSICYAMMKYYRTSPTRLHNTTMKDLKPLIIQSMKRAFLLGLLLVGGWFLILILVVIFSAMTSLYALFVILVLATVVFIIPLSMAMPVYIFEDDESAWGAVRRSISLGFHSFWSLLGLMIVVGLLANVLQTVTTLPWYISFLVKVVLTSSDAGQETFANSPIYNFIGYLLSVFMNFGMYLTMSLSTIALAYHYGSVAEEVDGLSVVDDIENFEQLAEEDRNIDNFDKL